MSTVMIRVNTLFFKLFSIKKSDEQIFRSFIGSSSLPKERCDNCSSEDSYSGYDSYSRMMICLIGGKRAEIEISVPRVKCHCGRTHALLPDILIPFSSYSLRFIISILWRFIHRRSTVAGFCEYWEISVSTIYYWKHLLLLHYSLWADAVDRIRVMSGTAAALISVSFADELPSVFYKRFGFSFLQSCAITTGT